MINVIDHGTGNIASINNFLERVNAKHQLASEPKSLDEASHIIIPGVGHFESAIIKLKEKELDKAIINAATRGIPILGICLGMQILYDYSEEGMSEGLGLMKGRVVKMIPSNIDRFKIPNVGWLGVEYKKASSLFKNINCWYFLCYSFPGNKVKIEQGLSLTFMTERPFFVFNGIGQLILFAESMSMSSIA